MATQLKPPAPTPENPWLGFEHGLWQNEINLRAFILKHVTPYYGDEAFLAGPTARTTAIWDKLTKLFVEERKKGVLTFRRSRRPSPRTIRAISTRIPRSLSGCRPMRR